MQEKDHNPPQRLGEILTAATILDKCENCGIRFKYGGKAWCQRCQEVWQRSQLPDKAKWNLVLNQVEDRYINAEMSHLDKELCLKLDRLMPTEDLFLWGKTGTGKTYAMAALLKDYIAQGFECVRINFDDFCTELRSTMSFASKVTEWDMIKPLKNIDKLFIDDLGMRSKQETDFAFITFYTILNKRQERLLPTYITTNKSIDELEQKFDSRIASRLRTAVEIHLTGKDRRLT